MISTKDAISHLDPLAFLSGGGEIGERIRTFDWENTPLSPISRWSPALRTMLRILLANRFPHILWWGPHYIQFYNDPYRPVLGTKHPDKALGRPISECWTEILQVIGPLIDLPFNGGPATWDEDVLLEINRQGFVGESHFTIAYSPVPDETVPSGIGGVLATVHEITGKAVGDRHINGVGIPENLEIEDLDNLGLQLVTTLVDQLDGEIELKRDNGTEFTIKFTVTEKNNQATAPETQQSI